MFPVMQATYGQEVIDHHEQILDGCVFRHVTQKIQERLGWLISLILQVLCFLVAVECADALIVLVGDHLRLVVGLPVDFLHSDVASLLLEDASGRNHIWRISNDWLNLQNNKSSKDFAFLTNFFILQTRNQVVGVDWCHLEGFKTFLKNFHSDFATFSQIFRKIFSS